MWLCLPVLLICLLGTSALPAPPNQSSRIIGGQDATVGQFPFSAAFNKTTKDGIYFCGGAIVSNQYILTAGHCVDGGVVFNIMVGSNHLYTEDSNRLVLATSTYILHPDYNLDTISNDIGLLHLHLPIIFNPYIRSIYLPTSDGFNSTRLFSTGWGQVTNDDSALSNTLNYLNVAPISNDECRRTYGSIIDDSKICVVGNNMDGTCYGDMGSPVVQFMTQQVTWHIGIASFIPQAGCQTIFPSGYTRTFYYVDWIHSIINDV